VEIIMSDGTVIIPSQDPEGNGAGHLFIFTDEGGDVDNNG